MLHTGYHFLVETGDFMRAERALPTLPLTQTMGANIKKREYQNGANLSFPACAARLHHIHNQILLIITNMYDRIKVSAYMG
jgi:hypothetical protein